MSWTKYINVPLLSLVVWLPIFFIACATQTIPTPEPIPSAITAPAQPTWELKWEKLIEAAKKEGRVSLMISGWSAGTRDWVIEAFRDKFRIATEVDVGSPGAQIEKLLRQRRTEIFLVDVYIGGTTTLVMLKNGGILAPLDDVFFLPQVVNKELWGRAGLSGPFWDKEHKIASSFSAVGPPIVVHDNLVKSGEIKGFKDLLNPKWKGNMVMKDPTAPGRGQSIATFMLRLMGEDYIKKFVQQEIVLSRDDRLSTEWVARGKFPIGIALPTDNIVAFKGVGVGLTEVAMSEGGSMTNATGNIGLLNQAPHPNAAKLFINWLFTKEAQEQFSKVSGYASRRLDVSNEWLPPTNRVQPGVKYIEDTEDSVLEREQIVPNIIELFKPLTR